MDGIFHLARWRQAAVVLGLGLGTLVAQDQPPSEYQVKAAFLYNFAKFVEWPAEAFPQHSPFTFCVVGDDPFQGALDDTVEGHNIAGRPLAIRRLKDGRDLESCQIAFVGAGNPKELQRQAAARRSLVLTVGESEPFVRWGGVINLIRDGSRVRFEINPDAAARVGLKISSKLLALAKLVRDPKDR